MIVTIVHVKVIQEHIDDFIEVTRANHLKSIHEPGNLRFDVLQKKDHPSEFALYEAYENAEAAAAHKETPHYLEWREKVAPWMEIPREGVKYTGLLPEYVSSSDGE
jgi:autoinducer 2-degrading protein